MGGVEKGAPCWHSDAKAQVPGAACSWKCWNLVAVEGVGAVVRDEVEGVGSNVFCRMLCAL